MATRVLVSACQRRAPNFVWVIISRTCSSFGNVPLLKYHAMKTYWGSGVVTPFLTSIVMEVSGQLHAPTALSPGKHLPGKLSGPQSRCVHCAETYNMKMRNRLDNRGSRVRFLAETGNISLHHRVQNGSGAHPASYPMGTGGSFTGGKAAGA
jgi:hypothetical protein